MFGDDSMKQVVIKSAEDMNRAIAEAMGYETLSLSDGKVYIRDIGDPVKIREIPNWAEDKIEFWDLIDEIAANGVEIAVGKNPDNGHAFCTFKGRGMGGLVEASSPAGATCVVYLALRGVMVVPAGEINGTSKKDGRRDKNGGSLFSVN